MIVTVPPNSDFTLENIPFGVVRVDGRAEPRPATIVGDTVVLLGELANAGLFNGPNMGADTARRVFTAPTLNEFMALGRPAWREARGTLQKLLSGADAALSGDAALRERALVPVARTEAVLPIAIGDYTDFYASKEHATNVGTMFRGKDNALMPNWVRLPVGYHGRASSVVVSGTPLRRPHGLIQPDKTQPPVYSASRRMDFELEVAFVVGRGNALGEPVKIADAEEHIFGLVLMNDWSARDIQAFEYVPLGPFLGKNFGTTVSPWIVTLDALAPYRTELPEQDPRPADYLLADPASAKPPRDAFDVALEVAIRPSGAAAPATVCRSNLKYMYWSVQQQLAHHTVNGCNMNTGDLCGSGTISGSDASSFGSMLELSWNGTKPVAVGQATRSFIEDGDEVVISGHAGGAAGQPRVGFGTCRGVLLPSL